MKAPFAMLLLAGCATGASLVPAVRVNEANVKKVVEAKETLAASPCPDAQLPPSRFVHFAFTPDCREAILQDGRGKDVSVLDVATRRELWRAELGEYVTGLASANDEWIVFTYPTADRQGAFHIFDRQGHELAKWPVKPDSNFGVVDGKILTVDAQGFTLYTSRGEVVQRFAATGGEHFQRPLGVRLEDGRWALVAGGSGYVPYYMVALFSADGDLLYQEIAEGRAHALTASADSFLIRDADRVLRYSLP